MATIIIKKDPLSDKKDIIQDVHDCYLVQKLSELYPDGFQTQTKVYKDSPHEANEITLNELDKDILIEKDDIYWICHFPMGLEVLIVGAFAAGLVGYNAYQAQQGQIEKAEEAAAEAAAAAQAALDQVEIIDETNLDVTTIGKGTSSNNVISAQQNAIRLGQKIPITYGYIRSFPDLIGDAYNEFTRTGIVGNQTLYQYFVVSSQFINISDALFPNIARIGNQPLTPGEDTISLRQKTQTIATFYDYVEYLKAETQSIIQNVFSGDYEEFDFAGPTGEIIVTATSIRFRAITGAGGATDPYGIYQALTQSEFVPNDRFQMYSDNGGLSGTFRLTSFEIVNEGGGEFSTYLYVNSLSGIASGTYSGTETIGLSNLDGRFAGARVKQNENLPYPTTVAASGLKTILLNKRPQVEDVNSDDYITVNITFPNGYDINGGFSTRFEIQPIQVNEQGIKIGTIGSPVIYTQETPADPGVTFTLKTPVTQVNGRLLGVEIQRTEGTPNTPFNERETIVYRNESVISSVGHLVERTNYTNDLVSIVELVRTSKRSSQNKPATGQFNLKLTTGLPLFDFGTGAFGALTFGESVMSWHQVFMNHAVNVGKIPISQIDYEQLEAIDQDIRLENGNQTSRFDFTFSNKGSTIDEELSLICNSVRVTMYKDGSTYKFSRDQVKTKVGNITSRNCSFQNNTKGITFNLPNPQDGIELEFINGSNDKAEIIYVPSNRSAQRPKRIFLSGVTDPVYAWRRAQYEYYALTFRRVTRSVLTTKEAVLWDLFDRLTVYDHTRLSIVPYDSNFGGWRQETEVQFIDTGDVIVGSEKLITDTSINVSAMAMELNLDLPDGTGLGVVQNVLINIDPDDARRFTIDPSTDPGLTADILAQIRTVGPNGQIGERIFVYPVEVTDKQLTYDDYLIVSKVPEGEHIRVELIRYNEDIYQDDDQNPPA